MYWFVVVLYAAVLCICQNVAAFLSNARYGGNVVPPKIDDADATYVPPLMTVESADMADGGNTVDVTPDST